jgi:hypothetical protein
LFFRHTHFLYILDLTASSVTSFKRRILINPTSLPRLRDQASWPWPEYRMHLASRAPVTFKVRLLRQTSLSTHCDARHPVAPGFKCMLHQRQQTLTSIRSWRPSSCSSEATLPPWHRCPPRNPRLPRPHQTVVAEASFRSSC